MRGWRRRWSGGINWRCSGRRGDLPIPCRRFMSGSGWRLRISGCASARRRSGCRRICDERRMSALLEGAGVHPENFPDVAVEVLEGVAVHEAVVVRGAECFAAGGGGFADHVVDFIATFAGEGDEDLGGFGGVDD